MNTKLESNEPLQWCETHQGNCLTVHPVKRPGTLHWIFVCPRCLNILKKAQLVTLVHRGQPFQHYHLLPAKLVAPTPTSTNETNETNETQSYELLITSAQAVILRALGYQLQSI